MKVLKYFQIGWAHSVFRPYHYYNVGTLYAFLGALFAIRVIAS